MTVSPKRTYRCADCGRIILRGPGGIVWKHRDLGVDHAPRVVER